MSRGESPESNIASLYGDLNRLGQNQDYERALKITNRILADSSNESKAFQCKIICLIQLGRFNDALIQIQKQHALSSGLQFERAYCEYRLNRTKEALSTLRAVENPDNRTKELLAQVLYRMEDYSECYKLYKDLIKNSEDDFDEERQTNLASVLASLQLWGNKDIEDPGLRETTYEMCYNNACILIGKGKYKEAEEKLHKAEEMCRKSVEEEADITEEDIESEVGIIRIQLAYLYQLEGKVDEALKIGNQVLKQRPSDIGLAAVASNNMVCLNKDQNVFDSKKKMKVATGDGLQQKLTTEQRKTIAMNQCLLFMHTNQGDQCKKSAANLKKQFTDSDRPALIEAAQYMKEKQTTAAIDILQQFIKMSPDHAVNIKLTMAQLYLSQGAVYQACDVLRSLGELTHKPGVISALVTMYMSQEDRQAAMDVLKNAVHWYKANHPKSGELGILMQAMVNHYLKIGAHEDAANMLEELRKLNSKDPRILAQLISAYSQFDPKKAESISKDLPSVDKIADDVDVDALEASALGPKYLRKTGKDGAQPSPVIGAVDALNLIVAKKKKVPTATLR